MQSTSTSHPEEVSLLWKSIFLGKVDGLVQIDPYSQLIKKKRFLDFNLKKNYVGYLFKGQRLHSNDMSNWLLTGALVLRVEF